MRLNRKGQDIGFSMQQLGIILFITFIVVVILIIILVWAGPALGESLKRLDFW